MLQTKQAMVQRDLQAPQNLLEVEEFLEVGAAEGDSREGPSADLLLLAVSLACLEGAEEAE